MTDDTQKQDLAVTTEGTEASASSPDETEAALEVGEKEAQGQASPEADESQTEEGESTRAQSRQHELAQKLKAKADEAETLRKQLDNIKGQQDQTISGNEQELGSIDGVLPWLSNQASGEARDVTVEDYKRDVLSVADQLVNIRLGQYQQGQKRVESFREDLDQVESNYPELKPGGENFNSQLSAKVTKLYSEARAKNPDVRLKDFVDEVMSIRSSSKEEGKEEAQGTLARQESEAALSPGAPTGKRLSSEQELSEALAKGEITAEEAERYLPRD